VEKKNNEDYRLGYREGYEDCRQKMIEAIFKSLEISQTDINYWQCVLNKE
jgi:hypothetical protein